MISKKSAIERLRQAYFTARMDSGESRFAQGLLIAWQNADIFTLEEYDRAFKLLLNTIEHSRKPFPHDAETIPF